MTGEGPAGLPHPLTEEDRERFKLAHHRLRKASQELESLVAPPTIRGRWAPTPVPPEVLATAHAELERAWLEVGALHRDLLGWPPSQVG